MKKHSFLLLAIIFVLGFIIRVIYLKDGALTFGYDQGRDAFISQQIVNGDLKVLGPPASTPGLYHGVFYYYFLAPAYWLGDGDPVVTAYWTSLFNAMGIFIVYILTYLFTKKITPAIIAALLFAVSFEATQYSSWLSNPTLGIWTVPIIYLGLWIWIGGSNVNKEIKWVGPLITSVGLGLSIQAEVFLAYHTIPIILWLYVCRKNITKRQFLLFLAGLLITVSSMFIVEFKFGFQSLRGIVSLLTSKDAVLNTKNLGDFVITYLNQIGEMFSNNLLPINAGYGGFLGITMLFVVLNGWIKRKNKKTVSYEPFLAVFILSHLSVVSLGGLSTPFLLVGMGGAAVILAAVFIYRVGLKNRVLAYLLVFVIVASNIYMILTENKKGQVIFSIQKDMLLSNELKVLDYIYSNSQNSQFSINSVTSPLWINTTWSYLFNWYGKNKYGYLPQWRGKDQVGQLGNNFSNADLETNLHFLIIEPPQGLPGYYIEWEEDLENSRSNLIEEVRFNDIRVQKRMITEQK